MMSVMQLIKARCFIGGLFFFCMLFAHFLAAQSIPVTSITPVLKVPNSNMEDYYVQLLHKALVKAANGRQVPLFEQVPHMEQARALHELQLGKLLHVHWVGSNPVREKILRAIPIPLDRGLLGYRQFIVHSDSIPAFDKVNTLDDLKHLIACQGLDWPDVEIMRAAGLHVKEVANFESLFRYVAAKRCDYFPREYLQISPELIYREKRYPSLTSYRSIVLYYPLPFYFFVSRENEELAQWIEDGLEAMIADGEFMTYMKTHPYSAPAFIKPTYTTKMPVRFFSIENPLLPPATDYKNPRYWFQPDDIAAMARSD